MHFLSGASLIAPRFYFGVDDPSDEDIARGEIAVFKPCLLEAGSILPIFSTDEVFRNFFKVFYAREDAALPAPWNPNLFELANLAGVLGEAGVTHLVVNPVSTAAGRWTNPREIMTVSYLRRLTEEMEPELERLFADAVAELGYEPESAEDVRWAKRWCAPRVEEVMGDAHARIRRREADGS